MHDLPCTNPDIHSQLCLLCYTNQSDVQLEPCRHSFHTKCLQQMSLESTSCPMCNIHSRQSVPVKSGSATHQLLFGNSSTLNSLSTVRRGKWTLEESAYCDRLIDEFKKGMLPLSEGTTLRSFLSKLLHCDPMRISKKYTGDQCIGKIIFRKRDDSVPESVVRKICLELASLEKKFIDKEEIIQRRREKRIKTCASITTRACAGYGFISSKDDQHKASLSMHSYSQMRNQIFTHESDHHIVENVVYYRNQMHVDQHPQNTDMYSQNQNYSANPILPVYAQNQSASHMHFEHESNHSQNPTRTVARQSHMLDSDKQMSLRMGCKDSESRTLNASTSALALASLAQQETPQLNNLISRISSFETLGSLFPRVSSIDNLTLPLPFFSSQNESEISEADHSDSTLTQSDAKETESSTEDFTLKECEPHNSSRPMPHTLEKLSRIASSEFLSRISSFEHLNSFTSLSKMPSCSSFGNLAALNRDPMPRNSSVDDILSLLASSESLHGLSEKAESEALLDKTSARGSGIGGIGQGSVFVERSTAATLLSLDGKRRCQGLCLD